MKKNKKDPNSILYRWETASFSEVDSCLPLAKAIYDTYVGNSDDFIEASFEISGAINDISRPILCPNPRCILPTWDLASESRRSASAASVKTMDYRETAAYTVARHFGMSPSSLFLISTGESGNNIDSYYSHDLGLGMIAKSDVWSLLSKLPTKASLRSVLASFCSYGPSFSDSTKVLLPISPLSFDRDKSKNTYSQYVIEYVPVNYWALCRNQFLAAKPSAKFDSILSNHITTGGGIQLNMGPVSLQSLTLPELLTLLDDNLSACLKHYSNPSSGAVQTLAALLIARDSLTYDSYRNEWLPKVKVLRSKLPTALAQCLDDLVVTINYILAAISLSYIFLTYVPLQAATMKVPVLSPASLYLMNLSPLSSLLFNPIHSISEGDSISFKSQPQLINFIAQNVPVPGGIPVQDLSFYPRALFSNLIKRYGPSATTPKYKALRLHLSLLISNDSFFNFHRIASPLIAGF